MRIGALNRVLRLAYTENQEIRLSVFLHQPQVDY